MDMHENAPIRILHVSGSLAGGVGSVLMRYYRHIDRDRVQFDFVVHNDPGKSVRSEVERLGGSVITITPKSTSLFGNVRETVKLINRSSPHKVVHVHTASPTSFVFLLVAWLAGKRVRIAHSHATSLESPRTSLQYRMHRVLRYLLNSLVTDRLACSDAAGVWLFGARKSRNVSVVPNAIRLDEFRFDFERRKRMRQDLVVADDIVVGHVGRFVPQKNHQFVINVLDQLLRVSPGVQLLLVGDGPLFEDVQGQVARLGIEDRVHFLGNRADVSDLYQAMDVLLLPSHSEGLPVVVVEAQANGLPSLVSTEVTTEVALSEQVEFLSLSDISLWVERVFELAKVERSGQSATDVVAAGYDIVSAGHKLTEYYLRRMAETDSRR